MRMSVKNEINRFFALYIYICFFRLILYICNQLTIEIKLAIHLYFKIYKYIYITETNLA